MAQSAVTVTPPNPTPPTNMGAGIANANATPPNQEPYSNVAKPALATTPPPALVYPATVYNDPWHPGVTNPTHPTANNPSGVTVSTAPPYLDDGAVGTPAGGANQAFAAPNSGTAAEGAGTESIYTKPDYNPAVLIPGSVATYSPNTPGTAWAQGDPGGPVRTVSDLGNFVGGARSINQQHASSATPANVPVLSSINPTTTTGGTGTIAVTATGTDFTTASKICADGVPLTTTFASGTSISANVPKKAAGGSTIVTVVTSGNTVTAATKTLSFT